MHLHLQAQLTAGDYGRALVLNYSLKKKLINMLVLAWTMTAVFALYDTLLNPSSFGNLLFFVPLSLLLGYVYAFPILSLYLKSRAKKIYKQQIGLQRSYEIDLSDDFYSAHSERGQSKVPWGEFHKWNFNDTIILIYSSDAIMHMFPRRWFETDADYQTLKGLLQQVLGDPGRPKKTTTHNIAS